MLKPKKLRVWKAPVALFLPVSAGWISAVPILLLSGLGACSSPRDRVSPPSKQVATPDSRETAPEAPNEPAGQESAEPAAAAEPQQPASVATGSGEPLDPSQATATAPDEFDVVLTTTKGSIRIHVTRAWSPRGADRFFNLVRMGYYNDTAFFRVLDGFMAQVGMHGDPETNARFRTATIDDDPVVQSNRPGYVTFAKTNAPNSRTTQFFINSVNNAALDRMGFSPFGVTEDMSVVRALYSGYGEPPTGPNQGRIAQEGNAYLKRDFPDLDYIVRAEVVGEPQADTSGQ